jgi:hypothetical protein
MTEQFEYEFILDPNTGIKIWNCPPEDQAFHLINILCDVLANADALVRELELARNASGKKQLQLQAIEFYAAQVFFELKAIREAIEENPARQLRGVRRELVAREFFGKRLTLDEQERGSAGDDTAQ